ncbi:MAG: LysR family transcriptional regulator [Pseudolabrys sp.]|nr:LysR family transcriptional regulator [Pseudolabrys sp.]
MELRHLRYFAAVAEELHFARAAERLNIAAPTLSHQIGALETILGTRLLTRKTKSAVTLTHSGKRFLIEALETLKQAAHAETVGRRAARGDAGSISIGYVLSACCSGLVSKAMADFRIAHPGVSFELRRLLTFSQLKALLDDSLDVGMSPALQRYPSGLTGFVIERKPFALLLPEGHRLAARKQITPDMLIDEPFVAMSLESEAGFWGNIAAVIPPGASPRIVERAPDAFSVMTLVAAGVGISVLSESMAVVAMPGIVYRNVSGITRMANIAAAYRKNESAPVVLEFVKFLRAQARSR